LYLFGCLTCQPPLPDIPPQQIPGFGRRVPQLLADRPPQLQLGRPSLACHFGAAGRIFPDLNPALLQHPLFLNRSFIPTENSPGRLGQHAHRLLRLAAAMVVSSPGKKLPSRCVTFLHQRGRMKCYSRDLDPLKTD